MILVFTILEIVAWFLGILWQEQAWAVVYFALPSFAAVLVFLNRRSCARIARQQLQLVGGALSPAEEEHLLRYATFYFFPATSNQLSSFFSGACLSALLGLAVVAFRWLSGGGVTTWVLVGLVASALIANNLQVRLNPMIFVHAHLRKARAGRDSSRMTMMAEEDAWASERVRSFLARHPEVVGGNDHWQLAEDVSLGLDESNPPSRP